MSKQENAELNAADAAQDEPLRDTGDGSTRADETGDAAEPNAPTRIEANVGMNTILGGGFFGTGVQTDASDE